jgi:sortase family protein
MPHRPMGKPAATVALAVLLALVGTALVWVGLVNHGSPPVPTSIHPPTASSSRPSPDLATPRTGARSRHATRGGIPDPISKLVLPASRPVSISIPRLRIRSDLVRLGVASGGVMQVPSDPAEAGWYDLGPTPGELGPAVIAGHVTWNLVPAVFFRLGDLHRGDRVRVVRRDGVTATFEVRAVRRFPKVRFPTKAVFGTIDYAGLRLITCGGTYDASTHRYLDNIVAFARLVAARGGRSQTGTSP